MADDHHDSAQALAMHLELRGHDVRVASTMEDAVLSARAWRPEVAVVDIGLGVKVGYALALNLSWTLPSCRLIATSALPAETVRGAAEAAGVRFCRCLRQPVETCDLVAAVESETLN